MSKQLARRLLVCTLLFMFGLILPVAGGAGDIDPSSYPEIGDKEMGQLRWVLSIAEQDIEDFSNLDAENQLGLTAYRYSIAFMTYFLALEQYHKLPACPEIIQPRMDRFIQKIISKPVWDYWAWVSQGIPNAEPLMNRPYPEQHDPVGDLNIMYSGHLGHMIGLYEMLYRDMKWDRPGSIIFAWSEDEKFVYDNHSLQQAMYEQMKNNPWHSVACEPNMVFPECNQHPALSFVLYDQTHGTDLAGVNDLFMDFFLERKLIDPHSHMTSMYYLVKQDMVVSQENPRFGNAYDLLLVPAVSLGLVAIEGPSADGWTGSFMHAWQPQYIERHYPYQRDRHIKHLEDGSARLKNNIADRMAPGLQYGFFAMLAAEIGDTQTRDKLIDYIDKSYNPVWSDGAFHYPINEQAKCKSTSGKLLAVARANHKNGLWNMHNKPFDDMHFSSPKVAGVDFPKVLLKRAIYDAERKALIVTTEPGGQKSGTTTFELINLDPAKSYRLSLDGKQMGTYKGRKSISVEVPLDTRHDLVLWAD